MSEKDNNSQTDNANIKDSFLYSVNHAGANEIAPPDPKAEERKKNAKKKTVIRYIAMGICICVFVTSLFSIVNTLLEYRQSESFYDSMYDSFDENGFSALQSSAAISALDSFGTINSPKGDDDGTYHNLFARMKARIQALKEINPDIYGWIVIPGTENIDYPILQGADNDYYLRHEYTYGYMLAGSIFADYRCDKDLNGNFNLVIYGHNMQNGMMFSELIKFTNEEFFNENQYVYVYTDKGIYTYRIFSVYKTDYQYKYIETGFPTTEEFLAFAEEMKSNSMFPREGITFNENSRILTLSTCTNALWSDRYCVQAVMEDAYNEP